MGRIHIYAVTVEFGDCDPAQIAYFPNFFRWFDAASRHFFVSCGFPSWRETEKSLGIIGTPVVETTCRFSRPTTYGDALEVHTQIAEWRDRSFVMQHELRRGDVIIAACTEVRVFAQHHPTDEGRLQAVVPPEDWRRLCE